MKSVNKVILVGNVTRDPQLKETGSGQPVVTFGLATNREWTTKTSEKRSLAEYHNIAAWGRLAEICQKYLKKGKLIYVEGYLKTRSWENPEGIKMFRTEIVIQDMIMLNKRPDEDFEDYASDEEDNNIPPDDFDEAMENSNQSNSIDGDEFNF